MSEINLNSGQRDKVQGNKERLLDIFERLIPLVDRISDSIRIAMILGLGLAVWVFV